MAASTVKKKTTQLPIFIVAKNLPYDQDGEVYGLELKRAMEEVIGKKSEIECIQKVNGLWRLILWEKKHRDLLLQTGLNIRGYTVTLHSRNPYLGKNGEDQVRLLISNVPYSISNEEIIKSLDSIGVTVEVNDVLWENYRDENRGMLKTKTGRRCVFIDPPITPLPTSMQVAGISTAYLNYKGMQKKQKNLGFRARHSSESQSDLSEDETETTSLKTYASSVSNKPQLLNTGTGKKGTALVEPPTLNNSLNFQEPSIPGLTGQEGESVDEVNQPQKTPSPGNQVVSDNETLTKVISEQPQPSGTPYIEPSLINAPRVLYPVFEPNSTSRGRSPDQKGAADRSRSGSLKRDSKEKPKKPAKKAKRMLKADGSRYSNSSTALLLSFHP